MADNKIGLSQPEMMAVFLNAIEFMVGQLASKGLMSVSSETKWSSIQKVWQSRLSTHSQKERDKLKFKDLEEDFTPWFREVFQAGLESTSDRSRGSWANALEEAFQKFRFEEENQKMLTYNLRQVLAPEWDALTRFSTSVFVPACGMGYEMAGILSAFDKAKVWMCDISGSDIAVCEEARKNLPDSQRHRVRVSVTDLLKDSLCDEEEFYSLILWFHPLLTTNEQYREIVGRVHRASNDKKAREAVRECQVAPDFERMFVRVIETLSEKGRGVFSFVEEAECILFAKLAEKAGLKCSLYKNNFALKKATSYLAPRRPPKVIEPRSYYYWAKVSSAGSS